MISEGDRGGDTAYGIHPQARARRDGHEPP